MRLDSKQLLGLPVFTASGLRLGKVLSLVIDAETHMILAYRVGARRWPLAVTAEISPRQVIRVSREQMTVEDAAVGEREGVRQKATAPVADVSPIATSKIE